MYDTHKHKSCLAVEQLASNFIKQLQVEVKDNISKKGYLKDVNQVIDRFKKESEQVR